MPELTTEELAMKHTQQEQPKDLVTIALETEASGVPVDWKALALNLHQQASAMVIEQRARIRQLEEIIEIDEQLDPEAFND